VLNPAAEGILHDVDTNGLASGNGSLEAIVHALAEVIERDALSQLEFTTLFGDVHEVMPRVYTLEPASLPDEARVWIERSLVQGLSLVVQYVATDIAVPTFRAVLVDRAYPSASGPISAYFPGFGTHPNKAVALLRSLGEALQARVGFIHGGRDSFNEMPAGARRSSRRARLATLFQAPRRSYADIPTRTSLDLRDDARDLLSALRAAGFEHVAVSNLTRSDWGIPVVRVRVPGLSAFMVNRRRVDFRCLRHLV
jgi:ribosomal protein S12 methylthiotransferase accessory factor